MTAGFGALYRRRLAVALNNHGVDVTTAPIAAAAIEIAVANNNAYIARVATLESTVAAQQAQIATQAAELNLFKIYLNELCQRVQPPLQIPGTSSPCALQ